MNSRKNTKTHLLEEKIFPGSEKNAFQTMLQKIRNTKMAGQVSGLQKWNNILRILMMETETKEGLKCQEFSKYGRKHVENRK